MCTFSEWPADLPYKTLEFQTLYIQTFSISKMTI